MKRKKTDQSYECKQEDDLLVFLKMKKDEPAGMGLILVFTLVFLMGRAPIFTSSSSSGSNSNSSNSSTSVDEEERCFWMGCWIGWVVDWVGCWIGWVVGSSGLLDWVGCWMGGLLDGWVVGSGGLLDRVSCWMGGLLDWMGCWMGGLLEGVKGSLAPLTQPSLRTVRHIKFSFHSLI